MRTVVSRRHGLDRRLVAGLGEPLVCVCDDPDAGTARTGSGGAFELYQCGDVWPQGGDVMAGTRWVRLDLEYFGNPKAQAAGLHGRAVHLAAICWSAAHLTDGRIPPEAMPRILADAGVRRAAVVRAH